MFISPSLSIFVAMLLFVIQLPTTNTEMVVISSLANARSFIYTSGEPLYVNVNQSDIWRICPRSIPPTPCYQTYASSSECAVITPDCRCYNWIVEESESVITMGSCIYINIGSTSILHQPLTLTWVLDYTYPVLPAGYTFYQRILYNHLIYPYLSFNDYSTVTSPLLCEAAKRQSPFNPVFDLCIHSLLLNISYIPGAVYSTQTPSSIGPFVVAGLFFLAALAFTLKYLRHPKTYKLE